MQEDVADVMGDVSTQEKGVFVQASTLGSLEALMEYLKSCDVPVAGFALGPVRKRDVMRASAMLPQGAAQEALSVGKEYATVLAFDVKVDPDAAEEAEALGIKILTADVIYHLTDQFNAHLKQIREERKAKAAGVAVFPCVLKIISASHVFYNKNPLVLGVEVARGVALVGTPLVVKEQLVEDPGNPGVKTFLYLGRIESIENDHKPVKKASRGEKVCIKIAGPEGIQVGRHFEWKDTMVSKTTRASIDALKANFKEDVDALKEEGWPLIVKEMKKMFSIP